MYLQRGVRYLLMELIVFLSCRSLAVLSDLDIHNSCFSNSKIIGYRELHGQTVLVILFAYTHLKYPLNYLHASADIGMKGSKTPL